MFANLYWYLFEKYKLSMEKTTGEQTHQTLLAHQAWTLATERMQSWSQLEALELQSPFCDEKPRL